MKEKFLRLVRLLRFIPREPHSIDVDALMKRLDDVQLEVSRRTVERDLVDLEAMQVGVVRKDDEKPQRWQFLKGADALLVPALDPHAALAFLLVTLHMKGLVPLATMRAIEPVLATSQHSINGKALARWTKKVRLLPRTQPLVPPKVDDAVLDAVQEALLTGRQLAVAYRKRGAKEARAMRLHPHALVFRDALVYVVACADDYDDIRGFPLHRISSATLSAEPARAVRGFDLDAYVARGELSLRLGEDVDLVLRFTDDAGRVVVESPLTADQLVEEAGDGSHVLRAHVADNQVLRSWLLGFGASVEVLEPKHLREAIAAVHQAAALRYATP